MSSSMVMLLLAAIEHIPTYYVKSLFVSERMEDEIRGEFINLGKKNKNEPLVEATYLLCIGIGLTRGKCNVQENQLAKIITMLSHFITHIIVEYHYLEK